ncbi:hypothetical protein PIB30_011446 [Stylosanthes scabra]|uniref:Uncharacterized protein n=1 Tax=Stylosanthes scabra TaxID=79078 RepID=A0ABU6Q5U2_9FABA|nr:hypothetical protein [Stylosanthes scabra]
MRSRETELYSSDWRKLGLFGKMNSISTTFMLKNSSSSKRFSDEFASEDECAENLLMLSILTFLTARPRAPSSAAAPPLLNDEVYVGGCGRGMDMAQACHCMLSTPFEG